MSPLWRTRVFIFFLACIAAGMGYLYFTKRVKPEDRIAAQPTPTPVVSPTPGAAPLSTDFAEMLAVPYDLDPDAAASRTAVLDFIANNTPGVVVLFGSSISSRSAQVAIQEIIDDVGEKDAPLIAVDHEGGTVQRLNGTGFTKLPTWRRMCTQTSEQRIAELATSAAELQQVGIDIVFAPMLDVGSGNPVLRDRLCSDDPEAVAQAAQEYVATFQDAGIFSVVKHFPGIGSVAVDTHTRYGTTTISEKDVQPFKAVLDHYPSLGVMTAHVGIENQTTAVPCSLNIACVGQIYELYPEAVVFTDALEMQAARYNSQAPDTPKSLEAVSVEAVSAGSTVLVYGPEVTVDDLNRVLSRLKLEYTSSSEFRKKVDQAYNKIQKVKEKYR